VSRALALLRQPAEIQKLVADESISPAHLRPLEAIADESKRVELAAQAAKERLTVRETERRAREAAKSAGVQKPVTEESSTVTPVPPPDAIATTGAQASAPLTRTEHPAGELTTVQPHTIAQRIASWGTAVGSVVRGPWRDAFWNFYERMTDRAFWWRVMRAVLKFLLRFIPYGHEPEPSRLSKAIKEAFAEVNARNYRAKPATNDPKKPDSHPPKAA